ncbi:MAG: hypothetical protein ACE5GK_04110 [Nitrospiria bacterium]
MIFLSVIPIQTRVLDAVQIWGVKPDLAYVIAFVRGWYWGALSGLYWGLALGGLIDFFSMGVLGVGFIHKGIVGFIAGLLGRSFLHLSYLVHLFIFLLISVLHDLSGTLFVHGFGQDGFEAVRMEAIVIRACYNALLGMVCLRMFRNKINKKGAVAYGRTIFS